MRHMPVLLNYTSQWFENMVDVGKLHIFGTVEGVFTMYSLYYLTAITGLPT